ncbi:uncharacterized protein OGAPODRAFT_51454, partial [Ogataea polymorpha]|uniref:uncharacterized protein n=1 Tax=Ogataea polymorpha TaxID=460523 RepID=UPI0007F391AF
MAHSQAPPQAAHVDRGSARNPQSSVSAENSTHHQTPPRTGFRRSSFSKQLKSKLTQEARAPKTPESSESSEQEHEPDEFETRSLRFVNLRPDIGLSDFLDLIEYGPIENCSFELTPHASSSKTVILSFVKNETAFKCYSKLKNILDELRSVLESPEMELLPAKNVPLLPVVQWAIENDSATRAVCLSNIPSGLPLRLLYQELEVMGPIEHIKYIPNKNAAFVHFTSISTAIKCVEQLALSESILSTAKVFYSKEKNTSVPQSNGTAKIEYDCEDNQYSDFYSTPSTSFSQSNFGNRTIYLGNIHPETTAEEICNTIRGGLLESIKLIPDRHICFLTFIDSSSAAQFFATGTKEKVIIHGRRIKVDWGKHPGPVSARVLEAVEKHSASRNLYIGTEPVSEETQEEARPKIPEIDTLRRDFSIFGEIEQINFFKDGQCAFVNFLHIVSSINAVEDFNGEGRDAVHASFENRYKPFKIAYGKDRCANPPKA